MRLSGPSARNVASLRRRINRATPHSFIWGVFMRVLSFLAAAGLVTAGLVASAPTAGAAGTCSLYVPSRISIGQPYRAVTVKQGPNCAAAGVTDAAWTAYHPT